MDNLDNKYYLDNIKNIKNIKNNIVNYFIDNDIVINDDDEIKIKIKKFLLKYKRTIAMICLIILLIIGYHCDPYSINYNHINYNNIHDIMIDFLLDYLMLTQIHFHLT